MTIEPTQKSYNAFIECVQDKNLGILRLEKSGKEVHLSYKKSSETCFYERILAFFGYYGTSKEISNFMTANLGAFKQKFLASTASEEALQQNKTLLSCFHERKIEARKTPRSLDVSVENLFDKLLFDAKVNILKKN